MVQVKLHTKFLGFLFIGIFISFYSCQKRVIEDPKPLSITKSNWPQLGSLTSPVINFNRLNIDPSGNLYMTGFGNQLYKLNGNTWNSLTSVSSFNFNNSICALCFDNNGNIYSAGFFTDNTGNVCVAKWDGNNWTVLGGNGSFPHSSYGDIFALAYNPTNGYLYAPNNISSNSDSTDIVYWNGSIWSRLNSINGQVNTMYIDTQGNLYAGGFFKNAYGKYYLAKLNGSSWTEVGAGNNSLKANCGINSICSDASGNIYVAGCFTNANGSYYVAKWNGSAWSELGGDNSLKANGPIVSICADANNNIYASGSFYYTINQFNDQSTYVAKYNGNSWSIVGYNSLFALYSYSSYGPQGNGINAMAVDPLGTIYVTGPGIINSSNNYYIGKYP